MTQLATRNGNGQGHAVATLAGTRSKIDDMWLMAESIARSALFAVKNADQAFALMLLCESEGLHPMQAVKRYHIIQGRPAMRSDAMQGEFQAQGGKIKVVKRTAEEARAVFSHPIHQPEGFELVVTFDQYKKAGLTGKDNWKNHPDDMLWARLVTKGIRTIFPGIIAGIYSSEEVEDIAVSESSEARHAIVQTETRQAVVAAQVHVLGQPPSGFDARPYRIVIEEGVSALNHQAETDWEKVAGLDGVAPLLSVPDAHLYLMDRAVQIDRIPTLPPTKAAQFAAMKALYQAEPDWVRAEFNAMLADRLKSVHDDLAARRDADTAGVDPDIAAAAEDAGVSDGAENEAGWDG